MVVAREPVGISRRAGGKLANQWAYQGIQGSYKMAFSRCVSTRYSCQGTRWHIKTRRWQVCKPVGISGRGDGKFTNQLADQDEELASLQMQRRPSSTNGVTYITISNCKVASFQIIYLTISGCIFTRRNCYEYLAYQDECVANVQRGYESLHLCKVQLL